MNEKTKEGETMAQAPIMPVFTDALVGDTADLSMEQFGAYMMILIATWRNNGIALADDDARMAHLCRVGLRKWRTLLRPNLHAFFTINDTGWHQKRLEKEWLRVQQALEVRRNLGSLGGLATARARKLAKLVAKPVAKGVAKRQQPITIDKENPSSVGEVAARAFVQREAAVHARDVAIATPAINGHRGDAGTWKSLGSALGAPPPPPSAEHHRNRRVQQHIEWLRATSFPADVALYVDAQTSDDQDAARRMFELVEGRMRHDHDKAIAA